MAYLRTSGVAYKNSALDIQISFVGKLECRESGVIDFEVGRRQLGQQLEIW